jgi:O-acetyl-ADP-ribose deacetylase (regulator of RNase III)
MVNTQVLEGDLTHTATPMDAIVTLINPGGMWFGGVDDAIQRVAGGQYHAVPYAELTKAGLENGQVVVAKGSMAHRGSFRDVIFIVDALKSPLNSRVYTALAAAEDNGYQTVALPLMRTGVMAGVVERTKHAVVQQIKQALDRFKADRPASTMVITFVVYDDQLGADMLATAIL